MADLPASVTPGEASPDPSPQDVIQRAWGLLEQRQPPSEAAALVAHIGTGHPLFPQAQHVRGVCALRQGHGEQAKALLVDAIRQGDSSTNVWLNLTATATMIGLPDDIVSMILDLMKRIAPHQLAAFAVQVLRAAGFGTKERSARKDAAFLKIALPVLSILLDRREMDGAMAAESVLYEGYVKSTETEAHFAFCMERIAPLFSRASHAWRDELPALPQPSLEAPYKVGFFIHNASMLAHIEVLLNTLKGYRMLDEQPFEPTVYCFGGKSPPMEQALAALGVRLVMLNELFPETQRSPWQRVLRFRELIAQEGVQEVVWVSLVTMLPLVFGLRVAPVQTWFAMKYRNFSNEDIDGYVSGSALTRFGLIGGRRWRTAMLGVDDWYDPAVEAQAAQLRAALGDGVVVMTLARTEKMQDSAYLQALAAILVAHPEAIFLWAGREEDPKVAAAFKAAGVLERTRFIGWVNTRLYAQVADVFLDTFPFPCGFTLFQAMAAGKPVVIYDSAEAAQTGLWNFIKPLVEDGEGTAEERAELRTFIGDDADPLIALARSPEDYVAHAGRLIGDADARARAGEASRRFMARYFSDPRVMGSSLADHFMDLIAERRAGQSA